MLANLHLRGSFLLLPLWCLFVHALRALPGKTLYPEHQSHIYWRYIMAANLNPSRSFNNRAGAQNRPETEGYINGYLTRSNGTRGKIGAIKMVATNPTMRALIDDLQAAVVLSRSNDADEQKEGQVRLVEIVGSIEWEYNSVMQEEGTRFVYKKSGA